MSSMIYAARHYIRCHEHVDIASPEVEHHILSCRLVKIRVHLAYTYSGLRQARAPAP